MKLFKSFLLITLFCITGTVSAQDVIVKKDNTTILSKVVKISKTEIEYKKWSNLDGPTYVISVSKVSNINFQNGEVERFQEIPAVVSQPVVETTQPLVETKPVEETQPVVAPIVETKPVETPVVVTPIEETPVAENPVAETQIVEHQNISDTPNIDTENDTVVPYNHQLNFNGKTLTLNGRLLTDEDIKDLIGEQGLKKYKDAKTTINTGNAFYALSGIFLGAAIIAVPLYMDDEDEELLTIAGVSGVAGLICLPIAIGAHSSGKKSINCIVDEYNTKGVVSFNISPSVMKSRTPQLQNSYGLGLTFSMKF